jgi:hypothetical protein
VCDEIFSTFSESESFIPNGLKKKVCTGNGTFHFVFFLKLDSKLIKKESRISGYAVLRKHT